MLMANRNMTPRKQSAALKAKALWLDKKSAEGVTQDDANLALGWSNSLFGQYINGRVPMGVEAIVKIAGFLGVKPWDIDPGLRDAYHDAGPNPNSFKEMVAQLDDKQIIRVLTQAAAGLTDENRITLIQNLLRDLKAGK